jgi:gliding motility-associated-like protein
MPRKLLLFVFYLGWFCTVQAQNNSDPRVVIPHVSPALRFSENLGQWDEQILFRAQLDGGAMYIEPNGLTFNFYDKVKYRSLHHGGILKGIYKNMDITFHAYKIRFENSNPLPSVEKAQQGPDYENFFLGNDKNKWRGSVKNYHQVFLRDLYPGIDYELITAIKGIKYNLHVKPNADPSVIKMKYEGIRDITLKDGTLILKLAIGDVVEQKPFAYQFIDGTVKVVKCDYQFKDHVLSFVFPDGYDKNSELVIDPILVFAAQSGSTADNFGMTATYDTQGNLYAGGTVFNIGYPTTLGAYSSTFNGPQAQGLTDVVVTKYNSTGNSLLYSTYIGGSQTEIISSMIVDHNDNLCFYGATGSSNFPMIQGCYDISFNGGVFLSFVFNGTTFANGTDIYVGKFNSSGTSLLASTFIGGSDNDGVNHVNHFTLLQVAPQVFVNEYYIDSLQFNYGDQYRGEIQLDMFDNIYIASSTRSSDFPTVNAYDASLSGKQDAVICKFNSNLTQLIYSTYLGGSLNDCGNALVVNSNSEVYVTGGTCSGNFPVTASANNTVYNGGKTDGFVSHFSAGGNTLLHSTFVGTNNYDQSYFVQSDKYNRIYIYGQSLGNMPVISSGTVFSIPNSHQFITRYNSTLSTIDLQTVFGGGSNHIDISPSAFAVDKCNNIYLSGWGGNILTGPAISNMPLFQPTQSTTDGFDFYFMGLDTDAVALKYGSYFGGNISQEHVDGGTSRFDPGGRIYQSICASCGGDKAHQVPAHQDFPVTPGAWPNTPGTPNHNTDNNNCNNGVVKLDFQLYVAVATINTNTLGGCNPLTVTFSNATPPAGSSATFTWDLGNGNTTSVVANPVVTYTAAGVYTVMLTVKDTNACNKTDRTLTYITVLPKPNTTFTITGGHCTNTISLVHTTSGNLGSNPYFWSFGSGNQTSTLSTPTFSYANNGTYNVSFTVTDVNGCKDVKTNTVSILNFAPGAASASSICLGAATTLTAAGGTSYTWSPGSSLNNVSIANPLANPIVTTVYTVDILNNSQGYDCGKTVTTQVEVKPSPITDFVYTVNPCGGGVQFADQSHDDIVAWQWSLTSTKTSTIPNPYYFYINEGTYTISLTSTNIYDCKTKIEKPIYVSKPPPLTVSGASAVCRGEHAQLQATGGVAYEWTPSQTLDFPSLYNPVASPFVSTEYSVVITTTDVVNGGQCKFMLTQDVDVDVLSTKPISASANPALIVTGDSSTLVYLGDKGALVTWFPLGSTKPNIGYTVTATPDRPTTYTAVARLGVCVDEATVHIDAFTEGCLEKDVFIPNTFTPNGDGQNDLFMVKGLKIDEVYFAIYNRWGEKVFETNDLSKGWDGRYKGKQVDVGVFGWYLRVKCINGEETFRKGNVTLIR